MILRARLVKLLQQVDALTLRERLAVAAALLVVIGGLWEAALAAPLTARKLAAVERIEQMRSRLAELDAALNTAADGIGSGMSGNVERLEALRERVADGAEAMRLLTTDLVDPGQMRFVLEDLLRRGGRLELVSIANLPVEPVLARASSEASSDTVNARGAALLYRHGLVLELEGNYLDCIAYLQSIENLPWRLYWSSLSLRTERHPLSRISIELQTLSLEEDWIGV